ncbi:MAG: ribonuclease HI family protein [Patescibacteria group bacterium]|jgi:ribonuclease HI|nr:ribonuclease HI family protein [Patescibacteria group bacterium]
MSKIKIYTDGGARGNPGPAGIGVVIELSNGDVKTYHQYLGETTNNQAEYQAIVLALEKARLYKPDEIDLYSDSELVIKQLNREYKIKNTDLGPWFIKIWNLQQSFKKVNFHHIPREQNKEADKLANQAMDERI